MTTTGLCLSKTEVAQLARTSMKARQLAFLRSNGIRHYVDQYGWPVVLRATLEGTRPVPDTHPVWKPNKAA